MKLTMSLKKFGECISKKSLDEQKLKSSEQGVKDERIKKNLLLWHKALHSEQPRLRLIHAISARGSLTGRPTPFTREKVESLFLSWDVISSSCVSGVPSGKQGIGALPVQLNLKVPVQNILGIHLRDVSFPNFAGLKNGSPTGELLNSYALADSVFKGKDKHNKSIGKSYNTLESPEYISQMLSENDYNEVQIIGRPNVRLYRDFPGTAKILLDSITYCPEFRGVSVSGCPNQKRKKDIIFEIEFIKKIMRINMIRTLLLPNDYHNDCPRNLFIRQVEEFFIESGFKNNHNGPKSRTELTLL